MAFQTFDTKKQYYHLKIYKKNEEHDLPGKDTGGNFKKPDFDNIIRDLNIIDKSDKYFNHDSLSNLLKRCNQKIRSKYLELIFREKDLFLNKDLYCLIFI